MKLVCKVPLCTTYARKNGLCHKHGSNPVCSEEQCNVRAHYRRGGVRGKCPKHGGSPRCDSCGLFVMLREGMRCSFCDPESKRRQKLARKEDIVVEYLRAAGFHVQREVRIEYSCGFGRKRKRNRFARIDAVIETPIRRVLLEVDENQHSAYPLQCETARMLDVMAAIRATGDERKTLWIRYNPDAFRVGGDRMHRSTKRRLSRLEEVIRGQNQTSDVQILFMYYDASTDGVPRFVSSESFPTSLLPLVELPAVI